MIKNITFFVPQFESIETFNKQKTAFNSKIIYFKHIISGKQPAFLRHLNNLLYGKGKVFPLQAWSCPDNSRKLRFPDYLTTAQDVGKVVSLMHRPHLPQEILLVLISVRGCVDPTAIVDWKNYIN
jgi:hypothetical protein